MSKGENVGDENSISHEQDCMRLFDNVMEEHTNEPLVGITFAGEPLSAYYRKITEYMHFNRIVKLHPGDTVLDLGGGIGRWAIPFASKCKQVTVVDISQKAIEVGIKEAEKRKLTNIKFVRKSLADYIDDQKYDIVFIGGVLIYIADKRLLTLSKNVSQMMNPGGKLVMRETVSILDKSFSISNYLPKYKCRYNGYYRTPEMLLDFFSKDFQLIYRRDAYVDKFVAKMLIRVVPGFLLKNPAIQFFCRGAIYGQAIMDPFLLKSKWLLERRDERLKASGDTATQYFFVVIKN
jgi:2-polyprenyl-3-methyl-5-hydroxy-6-metoxy-1,4-benzoquinol methylase